MPYRVKITGGAFTIGRLAQADKSIRASLEVASREAKILTEGRLHDDAPNPRPADEAKGHGVEVEVSNTERFAGRVKGGGTAVTRVYRVEVSLRSKSVAGYVEGGTGIYRSTKFGGPASEYDIHASPGRLLGPITARQGFHFVRTGTKFKGQNVGRGAQFKPGDDMFLSQVHIRGTHPDPWVEDSFDSIQPQIEQLYDRAVGGAI